jgi:Pyruvate phosphate dikinase, AMP/ATP-binding domain
MGQAVEVQAEPIKSSPQSPPATDSSPNPDIPVVVTLDDHQATDSRLVGAKATNLARLQHGGFAIPDGFCVTTAAYTILTQGRDVAELIERLRWPIPARGTRLLRAQRNCGTTCVSGHFRPPFAGPSPQRLKQLGRPWLAVAV